MDKFRVPQGRPKRTRLCQGGDTASTFSAVPAGLIVISSNPGVETPGYFQNVPAGHSVIGCPTIELCSMKKSWENSFCASAGNGLISRRIFHTFGHV
jgi:hypothetical protein